MAMSPRYCIRGILVAILDMIPFVSRNISTTSHLTHDIVTHRDSPENNSQTPFEFTEANILRISAMIQNYPRGSQRAVLGAALDIVQRQLGWVPISAMHKVAEMLCVPRIRVYEYCTFYTMIKRRYRGKYHVKVCSTTPCMIRGSECILKAAEEVCCCSVGGVSPDGMFGLDIVECAGACTNAPVMVVDDDYYEDLTECDVVNIITQIRNGTIPPPGPQSGRFASEPITGQTTLLACPPGPGYCIQQALWDGCPPIIRPC